MGEFAFIPQLKPQTVAGSIALNTTLGARPGCISVVGKLGGSEIVLVQYAVVADPDASNDAHWANLYIRGAQVTLTSTNYAEAIPVGIVIRVVKPVTANAVGLRWA